MAATFSNTTNATTGGIAGRPAVLPTAQQVRINHDPIPPWWYMAHPSRWYCREGEWLPQLGKLSVTPGQNNVKPNGDTSLAEALLRKEGWTILPWDIIEGGYVQVFDGVRGPVHLSRWETPRQVGAQLVIIPDEAGYLAFLRHLLADGIVAPPDPVVLDVLMERQAQRIQNNANRLHEPVAKARHDRDAALLEEMGKARELLEAAPPPAPKRGRRG